MGYLFFLVGNVVSARSKLARALEGIGIVGALLKVRSLVASPWLMTLCYHRVAEPEQSGGLDAALSDATPAQFDQQVGFLARHFNFVGLSDVVAFVTEGRALPPNPVLVTFDDGYKECFTTALPILRRHRAKAVFFIATDFITERRLFWWDRIAWAVSHATKPWASIQYPFPLDFDFERDPSGAKAALIDVVKKTRGLEVQRFLGEMEEAAGAAMPRDLERRIADETLMTWEDVRAMVGAGMDIGSHTRTHRVLQTLLPKDYGGEFGESREELERRLGIDVRTIAYPVGYSLGGDAALREAVRGAGYAVGFNCRAGVLRTSGRTNGARADAFDVPRLLMDASYDAQQFSAFAAIPALAPRTSVDLV